MDEAWNGQRGGRLGGVGKAGVRIWSAWHTVCDLAIPLPFQLPFSPKDDGQGTISRRTYLPLTVGQFILAGAYTAAVGVCVFKDAELRTNTNRLGASPSLPASHSLSQLTPPPCLFQASSPSRNSLRCCCFRPSPRPSPFSSPRAGRSSTGPTAGPAGSSGSAQPSMASSGSTRWAGVRACRTR